MGIFSSVGSLLNDVTGATSAAKMSQAFALQSAFLNNAFQKEFAQNAHQWEAQDLMKAGYNPALTTGLGGASAGGAGGVNSGTATASGLGLNPLQAVGAIVEMKNSTSATKAQVKLAKAEAGLKTAQSLKQVMENNIFKQLGMQEKKAIISSIIAGTDASRAMAKYTNERSRGYTISKTVSRSKQGGGSIFGVGGNGGSSYSKSTTFTR